MEIYVHPKFKDKLPFKISGCWPRKNKLWICYEKDINLLNGAKHIIFIDEEAPIYRMEAFGLCCYSMDDLINYINYKPKWSSLPTKHTYCITGFDRLRKLTFHGMLKKWDLVSAIDTKGKVIKYADWVLALDAHPPYIAMHYRIQCYLKNRLNDQFLGHLRKHRLYEFFSEYMMESYVYQNKLPPTHKPGDVWIVKPQSDAFSQGKGVSFVESEEDLESATRECKGDTAVIQRYFTDGLLYKGLKMHLRVWLILTTWGKFYVHPYYRVFTAKEPYVKGDWKNFNIHMSKARNLLIDTFYDLDKKHERQIYDLCELIFKNTTCQPFSESKQAYQLFGLDVMISEERVILLEVNTYPGRSLVENKREHAEQAYAWELDCLREVFYK